MCSGVFDTCIDYPKFISALRVNLYSDGVRIGFTKSLNIPLDFLDVFIASTYFDPDIIKRMHMETIHQHGHTV
ncbi:hypothetical protein ACFLU7_00825, partial [Chloroflexota bacterium]